MNIKQLSEIISENKGKRDKWAAFVWMKSDKAQINEFDRNARMQYKYQLNITYH